VDHQIARHPALDRWLELHLHTMGLHGPAARHLLKTRVVPAVVVVVVVLMTLLLLLATVNIRRAQRARAWRKRMTI
jgi:hypothetical protein